MSGGEQQMLAMGRALMARPKLLLLDEPSLGLAPVIVDRIYEIIREINEQGDDPARRAERQLRARRLRSRLRPRDRHGRADRRLRRAAHRRAGPSRLPGGLIMHRHARPRRRRRQASTCSCCGWPRRSPPASSPSARATAKVGLGTGLLLSIVGAIIWSLRQATRPGSSARPASRARAGSQPKASAGARRRRLALGLVDHSRVQLERPTGRGRRRAAGTCGGGGRSRPPPRRRRGRRGPISRAARRCSVHWRLAHKSATSRRTTAQA